ncbi:MAG: ATP-dependent RNA helicase dbp2 [Icmadophila ericetorum]|nr:ATP-dependent RNA helicase dbp2 [Icmadophila ericetorum]
MEDRRRILVIAGSDSSGGAGLEGDQKVIAAHGCYAMTATTALTAQNTQTVVDVLHTHPQFVRKQIDACIDDIGVDVVKMGMLASADTIGVVAEALEHHGYPLTVVDPVMVATSGAQLLPTDAVRVLREKLLPITTILTPNIPEAKLLLKNAGNGQPDPETLDDLIDIAKALHALGPKWVLLKGGHLPLTKERRVAKEASDWQFIVNVLAGDEVILIESQYQSSRNTHGTGCSLASAIASNIALGYKIPDAVRKACRYVEAGIRLSIDRGRGSGPINHFHSTYTLPFSPGHFVEYLVDQAADVWRTHTEHEFIARIADGSLPVEMFKYYLTQDYLFLIQFARANALVSYKATAMPEISAGAKLILHIEREISLHVHYCKSFGLSREDIESQRESQACLAYTRYVLDIGNREDWFALKVALVPCLIGYGMIARRLFDDPKTVRGDQNQYWEWIENYVADDYMAAVASGRDELEKYAVLQSPSRIAALVKIFTEATRLETGFWDMGYRGQTKD